jgi:Gluconate 2-dehydrogenase subunit 3
MDRRSAIRNVVFAAAGVALLPSCLHNDQAPSIKWSNLKITADEENLLADLAEAIIPKTTTPGAKDLEAHKFALTMVNDCFTKDERDKFATGLKGFEDLTQKRFSTSFSKLTSVQKEGLLTALEAKRDIPEAVLAFYGSMKRLTIQSFTSSKFYLTEVRKYEMAPGRYHGCVPVKSLAATSN